MMTSNGRKIRKIQTDPPLSLRGRRVFFTDSSSSQSEGENSLLCYSVPLPHLTRFMNNCVQIVIMIMLNISMAKGESLNRTVVLLKLDRGGSPVGHKMNKQNVM